MRSKAADFFNANESDSDNGVSDSETESKVTQKQTVKDDRFKAFSDDEDDEDDYNDDEEEQESKGTSLKRSQADVFASDEDEDEDEEDIDASLKEESASKDFTEADQLTVDSTNDASTTDKSQRKKKKKVTPLTPEEVEKSNERVKKTGLVYLSKIPPFMKPVKVRQILSRFGEVNRIFLVPEDPKVYQKRVKYGGNKKKNFVEGWAEFVKKSHAKLAADTLNGNIIGGKKGNYYHDDILNVKYLHKFKWHNLTDQIAYEKQVRQAKLRAEIAQATRENKAFIQNVERSKMVEGIKTKRKEKKQQSGEDGTEEVDASVRRAFDQRTVKTTRSDTSKPSNVSDKRVSNVLSRVF
ncbi:hypothetical protein DV495_002997 [Geotrichum candidum]|uniref:Pre-rRNA-processing protein ESF2 n=1 Tax=Geotrichum candidum TaxID=1173061 RepID=A0A0J9XEN5_GEOCN|nr:hypothetical protein DV452_004720 [Geotrichum candidum]KAI9210170.1 hypothetical protein DS838_004947 [Geotrichum bryndzae]KAF5127015.1 hypothetical protein DV495_002997 [Geotrichum candidum]KAF7498622.1 hypothetical protein DV113_003358 [Geotrichum candidum]KAI8131331.1 hypothetical protein DUD61_005009 [Geotrichum candidum]